MNNFTEVARTDEIPVGKMKAVTADGRDILVVNYEGKYYAIGRMCTHAGGDLASKRETSPAMKSRSRVTVLRSESDACPAFLWRDPILSGVTGTVFCFPAIAGRNPGG